MSGNLPVLPFLLSLFSAVALLLSPRRITWQLYTVAAVLILEVLFSSYLVYKTYDSTILVSYLGGWPPTLGISLVADLFSSLMLTTANIVFLCATLFYIKETKKPKLSLLTISLIFFLQTGVALSLLAGDYFNLFVGFEIMLVSSYAIMESEADTRKSKHVYHYLIISITTSALFLTTVAMIYGYTGLLNMAALSQKFELMQNDPKVAAIAIFVLVVFGVKAGIFPFYFWLPNSYASLPASLSGLFSAILTKVSVYVLFRLFITVFPHELPLVYELLLLFSGFTMFLGVLGAISNGSVKGILCYHILSQLGYIFMALGCFTVLSVSAGIFFTLHNMIVKSSLLLIGGMIALSFKTDELDSLKGVLSSFPILSIFFMVQALSLAGIPPLSGFWGKYLIFVEGLKGKHFYLVFFGGLTSFLTLFSMIKIWSGAFIGPQAEEIPNMKYDYGFLVKWIGVLVVVALFMGFAAENVIRLTGAASDQMFNKSAYIKAVLGDDSHL